MENRPGLTMYFLLKMGYSIAMLVYIYQEGILSFCPFPEGILVKILAAQPTPIDPQCTLCERHRGHPVAQVAGGKNRYVA